MDLAVEDDRGLACCRAAHRVRPGQGALAEHQAGEEPLVEVKLVPRGEQLRRKASAGLPQ